MSGFLLAQFERPEALLAAAAAAADAGLPARDALCPTPVEGLFDLLASPRPRGPIGWIMFAAGACGGAIGYFMQWYSAVVDYPVISGGRPMNSWPAFLLVPYETTILAAAIVGVLSWMALSGLPRLHHPLFAAPATERANRDRYLLVFDGGAKTRHWLDRHYPAALVEEA